MKPRKIRIEYGKTNEHGICVTEGAAPTFSSAFMSFEKLVLSSPNHCIARRCTVPSAARTLSAAST